MISLSKNELVSPKTFISYSWTTPEHEEWVLELATRLTSDGVEVILDKWDLREGNDVHRFMERMVHQDDSVDKVLIICDKVYKEKSDNRSGGVGVESQIITPQIYSDVQQEKFIPIVAERDRNGNHFIPNYIASRLYVDLSSYDNFEQGYEILIRSIYNRPMYKKPTIGKPPSFLLEEDSPKYLTTPILSKMRVSSEKSPQKMRFLWSEFEDKLIETLEDFHLSIENPSKLGGLVKDKIQQLIPLRNDFVDAIELQVMTNSIHSDDIIDFYEKIYRFTESQSSGTFYESQFDHFKFFIMESFLYTITILLKYKNYRLVADVINSEFQFDSKYTTKKYNFCKLRFHLRSLEGLNAESSRLSVHADLMNEFKHPRYGNELFQTDLILYYVSEINTTIDTRSPWFPVTYIYHRENKSIKFLTKLKSQAHFEEVKSIFGVSTKHELAERISSFVEDRGYSRSWDRIPHPTSHIDIEKIGTVN